MFKKIQTYRQSYNDLQRFADQHDFVSFGKVGQERTWNHVRGITFTPDASDNHYMHTNLNGLDITFLIRHALLSDGQDKQHKAAQSEWTILRANLLPHMHLPHIVLDNRMQSTAFYQHMAMLYPKLRRASHVLQHIDASAEYNFDLYIAPDDMYSLYELLDTRTLQRMAYYYTGFNVEIHNNEIILYVPGAITQIQKLNEMLAELLWLSQHFENKLLPDAAESASLGLVTA